MQRREFLLAGLVAPAALAPGAAEAGAPVLDLPGLEARVTALRQRMSVAGRRTLARYRQRLPRGVTLPGEIEEVVRAGFAAFSVVPSLRRMSAAEQATGVVQALLLEVIDAVGAYALSAHDALGLLLGAHDASRTELHEALSTLCDQDADEEFGRSAFVSLRQGRRILAEELARSGPEALLGSLFESLDALRAEATIRMLEVEDASRPEIGAAPPPTAGVRVVTFVVGVLLLGVAVVGAAGVVSGVMVLFGGSSFAPMGLVLALLGGLLIVLGYVGGTALLRFSRRPQSWTSSDGRVTRVVVLPGGSWIDTTVVLGETPRHVEVGGRLSLPERRARVEAEGLVGVAAGGDAPDPLLPAGALLARVGDWVGPVVGTGDHLGSAPRAGPLALAVNLPTRESRRTRGEFHVTITTRTP